MPTLQPDPKSLTAEAIIGFARGSSRTALPGGHRVGQIFNTPWGPLMWVEMDSTEDTLAKSPRTSTTATLSPVGRLTSDPTKTTADFSATIGQASFQGLLLHDIAAAAYATSVRKYALIATPGCSLSNLTALLGLTAQVTTDGQVAAGSNCGWQDDNLIGSNEMIDGSPKMPHPFDSFNSLIATAADSSTTLTSGVIDFRKTPLPDPSKVKFWIQNRQNPIEGMITAGDATISFTNFAVNALGPTSLKARFTGDGTANDEATATTPDKPFLYTSGKRFAHGIKATLTNSGTEGCMILGVFPGQANGSLNYIVDTTGALAAAAAIQGHGFNTLLADLKLYHWSSNTSTLDTNSAEILATLTTATEVQLMQRGVGATNMSIESFLNQAAVGTALTAPIASAVQMYFGAYFKSVASAIEIDFRDAWCAFEI